MRVIWKIPWGIIYRGKKYRAVGYKISVEPRILITFEKLYPAYLVGCTICDIDVVSIL